MTILLDTKTAFDKNFIDCVKYDHLGIPRESAEKLSHWDYWTYRIATNCVQQLCMNSYVQGLIKKANSNTKTGNKRSE